MPRQRHPRRATRSTSLFLFTLLLPLAVGSAAPAQPSVADPELNPRVYLCDPDGSNMRLLYDSPQFTTQGMPSWSSDGKRIVFEAWNAERGEINDDSQLLVINADGTNPQVLGDGGCPSFSPDGKRIAFRRVAPSKGVWIRSSAADEREPSGKQLAGKDLTSVAPEGWNPRWSPAGEQVAYIAYGSAPNLVVFDVGRQTKTPLFEPETSPYRSFLWNITWSPDGKRLAFRGQRVSDGKWELAIVDARGASFGLTTRLQTEVSGLNWGSDSNRIFIGLWTPNRAGGMQIYSLSPDNKDRPQILQHQESARLNSLAVHSPDGKQLLMVSRKPPPKTDEPIEIAK